MKKDNIKLGDKVKDLITGYTGIVVARTQFINGCIQYSIERKLKKGEEMHPDGVPSIDSTNLIIIEKKVIKSREYDDEDDEDEDEDDEDDYDYSSTGGPTKFMKRARGY